jgi:hydroxymethylbilane synthase
VSQSAPVRIGARASELATRQARMVASLLEIRGVESEVISVKTKGDRKKPAVYEHGPPPGLFTHELEVALAKKKIDCAVHSMKDLPLELREGLVIAAVLERDDPRDVLVVNPVTVADDLESLPAGSRVGASSVRRRAQLLTHRRDLEPVELRGSVPERLRKVETGRVHAAILSAESLIRLGVGRRITQYLDAPDWLPAVGQGAIAIEIRADDERMREVASFLAHPPTSIATRAERAFLAELEGIPQMPVAALAIPGDDGTLRLNAFVSHATGRDAVRGSIEVDQSAPEESGRALAREMQTRGVSSLLLELRNADKFPA